MVINYTMTQVLGSRLQNKKARINKAILHRMKKKGNPRSWKRWTLLKTSSEEMALGIARLPNAGWCWHG
jgi:hypothetical protein